MTAPMIDRLADALRALLDPANGRSDDPSHLPSVWGNAREALAAYDARKPEPPSLADALRYIRDIANAKAARSLRSDVFTPDRIADLCREALAAYDAQQAQRTKP